jgi:hypothetical protein
MRIAEEGYVLRLLERGEMLRSENGKRGADLVLFGTRDPKLAKTWTKRADAVELWYDLRERGVQNRSGSSLGIPARLTSCLRHVTVYYRKCRRKI